MKNFTKQLLTVILSAFAAVSAFAVMGQDATPASDTTTKTTTAEQEQKRSDEEEQAAFCEQYPDMCMMRMDIGNGGGTEPPIGG